MSEYDGTAQQRGEPQVDLVLLESSEDEAAYERLMDFIDAEQDLRTGLSDHERLNVGGLPPPGKKHPCDMW